MALYLTQHGLSTPKVLDPQKGLTDDGRGETERIAGVAKGYEIKVAKIVHSGKKRAEETAAIFHQTFILHTPLEVISDINPLDDVCIFAATVVPEADLMVVGHMPFLQRLVSYLTTGSKETRVYQFQNSGIVCLDATKETGGNYDWFIKWTLNPNII